MIAIHVNLGTVDLHVTQEVGKPVRAVDFRQVVVLFDAVGDAE